MCQHLVIDSHDEHESIDCCMCGRKKNILGAKLNFRFDFERNTRFCQKKRIGCEIEFSI